MRKLKSTDIFKFSKLVKKSKLKESVISVNMEEKGEMQMGMYLIFSVLEGLAEEGAEQEFYNFLAEPFELKSKEVEELDLSELMNYLEQLAKENNLTSFFKLAGLTLPS